MGTTATEAAIAEQEAELATLKPELEGLNDWNSINLQPATKAEIQALAGRYTRRIAFLEAAIEANKALMADGHPGIGTETVEGSIYRDLEANKATLDAAYAKFASNEATSLKMAAEDPKPKKGHEHHE